RMVRVGRVREAQKSGQSGQGTPSWCLDLARLSRLGPTVSTWPDCHKVSLECKGAGVIPTYCTFCTHWPGLHPLARSAPIGQVCTLWPGLHPLARFAPFGQVCT